MEGIEKQRLLLEENVAKLQKALQHWRTWDAEYEGLKEELLAVPGDAGRAEMVTLSKEFGGELVNEREVRDLAGLDKPPLRKPQYIADLVNKRQDYVQQNIRTISKQLSKAEANLVSHLGDDEDEGFDFANSAGLPISEIIEELDEDGNVLTSRVTKPEETTAGILETLRKVGVTDLDSKKRNASESDPSGAGQASTGDVTQSSSATTDEEKAPKRKKSVSFSKSTKPPAAPSALSHSTEGKKAVSFADELEEFTIPARTDKFEDQQIKTKPHIQASVNSSLINGSFNQNDRVIELDDDDDIIGVKPIIPDDESEEDARIRREMLEYRLNEIGPIVAELELEEPNSDDDFDDVDEFDDEELGLMDETMAGDTSDEDEDEYGRSTKKVISDDYRQQMLDLQDKLEERIIGNIGPEPEGEEHPEINPDELRRLVIRGPKDETTTKSALKSEEEQNSKKSVRFAETLDVQAKKSTPIQPQTSADKDTLMSEAVQERSTVPPTQPLHPLPTTTKPSRFKQQRSQQSSTIENEPPAATRDGILLDQVLERSSQAPPTDPSENDEYDPELQQRQLATEYYRMRNSMVRAQGGFKTPEDEDPERPLMEEVDGKVRKVSRFKAARMR